MSDGDRKPTTSPVWDELLADARAIADDYRESGWDAAALEPEAVDPIEDADRVGLGVTVSTDEYDLVEGLADDEGVDFGIADVYYRPVDGDDHRSVDEDDRRFAIAVERDESTETAVVLPLTYSIEAAQSVFERALAEETLRLHVRPASATEWIVFSHDDPSLFVAESDVRAWYDD